jgi:ketosteroid isomerase-like protein
VAGDNIELVHRGVEGLNRGEVDLEIIDPEVVFIPMRAPVQGAYHGHDGIRAFVADNQESFEVFHVTIEETHDLGDRVVAIGTLRVRGKGSGAEVEVPTASVSTYRDGRLIRFEEFGERTLALQAASQD